jgi:hypothetical protein
MSQISLWMKRDGGKNEFENFFIIKREIKKTKDGKNMKIISN